jgi:outer membrane protein TolC
LDGLFSPGSFAGSIGPEFSWNILNYGRIKNSVLLQDAKFQQAVFNYQDTVLKAQRESEDAIVGFLKSQEQTEKLGLAVDDIAKLNDLLLVQANAGATDFNRVFVVQAQLAAQQDNLATSQGAIALNLIRIYRSLGGGWQIRLQSDDPTFSPNANTITPAQPPFDEEIIALPPLESEEIQNPITTEN